MAITFVGASSGSKNSGTSQAITLPTVLANDFAVMAVTVKSTTGTATASGWTQIDATLDRSDGSGTKTLFLKRTLTLADSGASVTITTTSAKSSAVCLVFRGVNTSGPIDVYASQANLSSTTVTAPTVTPSATGYTGLWFAGSNTGTTVNVEPTGYTLPAGGGQAASGAGGASTRETTAGCYLIGLGSGATGTITGTFNAAATSVGAQIVLVPTAPEIVASVTGLAGTGAAGSVTADVKNPDALVRVGSTSRIISTAFTSLLTVAVTGVSGSGSVGTVTAGPTATIVAVTGVSGTGSVGSPVFSTNADVLFRVGSTSRIVSTGFTSLLTVAVTGVSGTGSVGTATGTSAGDVTVSVTGVSGHGYSDAVVESTSPTLEVDGVSGTASLGTIIGAATVIVTPTGVTGTSALGTVFATPAQNITHVVSGVSGSGSVGTVGVGLSPTVAVTGVSGSGAVGFLSTSITNPAVTTTISGGVSGTGSLGSVSTRGDVAPTPTGVSGTGAVGTVTAAITGNIVEIVTGVEGLGSVGFVTVLGIDVTVDAAAKVVTDTNTAWQTRFTEEVIVLGTGGLTTDSATNLLPANSLISHVTTLVTQAITGASSYSVGDATTAGRFLASTTNLSLGSAEVCMDQYALGLQAQTVGAPLRITTDGPPTTGALLVRVYFTQITPPTLG